MSPGEQDGKPVDGRDLFTALGATVDPPRAGA